MPPTLASDCRVDDADQDGHPGVTIALAGAFESEACSRHRDASQFTDGHREPKKAPRAFDEREHIYQRACATKGCTRANLSACPAPFNTALFAPLSALAAGGKFRSCELLLDEIAEVHISPKSRSNFRAAAECEALTWIVVYGTW